MTTICDTGFMNCTDVIGTIIAGVTQQTTGSLIITFILITIILMAIAMIFAIPIEYTSVIILPLLLAFASYYSEFTPFIVVILIYLSILIVKNFILK